MLKKLFYKVLCILCFGFSNAKAEPAPAQKEDKEVVVFKTEDGKEVKIYASQLLKLLISKVQSMKTQPKPEDMQKIFQESRKEIAALYALYLKNKKALLKDKAFLKQLLFSAVLLNRENMAAKISASLPTEKLKTELDKFIAQIPLPMVYRTKVIVLKTAEEAQRAISGLESGAEISSMISASLKKGEFENGKVIDKDTGSEYISIFSNTLPEQVRAALQMYDKPGKRIIVKTPIAVQEGDTTTHWVVFIEDIKKGSKKDLPTIDLKDERLKQTVGMMVANNELIKQGEDALKAMNVKMFKPDGSPDDNR